MKQNKVDSNIAGAGMHEQIFSVTNIVTDASNAERLNRWKSALRMFRDKPLLGFGPGTFQFQYISYQRKKDMTIISATEPIKDGGTRYRWAPETGLKLSDNSSIVQGSGGTAHSEFFLELAEAGIFSTLLFISLFVVALRRSLFVFSKTQDRKIKNIILFSLLGLTTYFVHAFFNNFLTDCKLAFLFWSFLCAVATLDSEFAKTKAANEKVKVESL
jgi:O-antigen ligase